MTSDIVIVDNKNIKRNNSNKQPLYHARLTFGRNHIYKDYPAFPVILGLYKHRNIIILALIGNHIWLKELEQHLTRYTYVFGRDGEVINDRPGMAKLIELQTVKDNKYPIYYDSKFIAHLETIFRNYL
jgi:hypothetical protein